jgi:hypothetical protein
MAVALIAYRQLRPATRTRLRDLLQAHPAINTWKAPDGTPPAEAEAFVIMKAATWPDYIRDPEHPGHEDHRPEDHYINFPLPSPKDFPIPATATAEAVLSRPNILSRLDSCVATLRNAKAPAVEKAKDLCWLLHLAGDVHQPLHCVARFSRQYPAGDRGGNDVIVASEPGVVVTRPEGDARAAWPTLHGGWDRILGNGEDAVAVREVADRCQGIPRKEFLGALKKTEFRMWAEEGVALAADVVYGKDLPFLTDREAPAQLSEKGSVAVPALPSDYLKSAGVIAERRVALAGYRLADLLERILGD